MYEIGTDGANLFGLRGPGVGEDDAIGNFGTDVATIFGTGDEAIEKAELLHDYGGAGLKRSDAVGDVVGLHAIS